MSRTRVFVPYSFRDLQRLVRTDRSAGDRGPALLPPRTEAAAVTDRLRAEYPDADQEELEYLAMTTAAQRSVALVDADGPHSRLVLAVDVDAVEPAGSEDDPAAVLVVDPVLLGDVVSAHVDSDDAARDVRDARLALEERAADAEDRLARCLDHELGWFAASELEQVALRGGGGGRDHDLGVTERP